MKILLPLICFIVLAACSASRNKTQKAVQDIPSCIADKIESFKNEPKQNLPRSVEEYVYRGKKVYYISSPCCDQYSDLFDNRCNLLGHPDGGITGKGDGRLIGFNLEATNKQLIWKDDR